MTSLVPVFYCFAIFIICRLFKFQIQVEDFLIMVYWKYHSHCFDVVFHKIVNFEILKFWVFEWFLFLVLHSTKYVVVKFERGASKSTTSDMIIHAWMQINCFADAGLKTRAGER